MCKNIFILGLCTYLLVGNLTAADWYVIPDGKVDNPGTIESPWDIASCLEGKQQVQAGDTVYFLKGIYKRRPKERHVIKLIGTKDIYSQPIAEGVCKRGKITVPTVGRFSVYVMRKE